MTFEVRFVSTISDDIKYKVLELYSIDITDFRYTIDDYGYNHAMNGHGGWRRELREDEIQITDDDFKNLEKYIIGSELVGGGMSRSRNLPTIMHIYEKDGVKIYVVFEILNKKRHLRFKTMYKNKKKLTNKKH